MWVIKGSHGWPFPILDLQEALIWSQSDHACECPSSQQQQWCLTRPQKSTHNLIESECWILYEETTWESAAVGKWSIFPAFLHVSALWLSLWSILIWYSLNDSSLFFKMRKTALLFYHLEASHISNWRHELWGYFISNSWWLSTHKNLLFFLLFSHYMMTYCQFYTLKNKTGVWMSKD